jgi:hypothetical protein|tara:strand:+ start:19824 stop:20009 length:186 start_codon:yes stop_codon:yes gene_type:complete
MTIKQALDYAKTLISDDKELARIREIEKEDNKNILEVFWKWRENETGRTESQRQQLRNKDS